MSSTEGSVSVILRYINEELLFGEDQATPGENLLESGLLDSINVFGLVQYVSDEFAVVVPPQDIVIENFGSVNQIADYVARRLSEAA